MALTCPGPQTAVWIWAWTRASLLACLSGFHFLPHPKSQFHLYSPDIPADQKELWELWSLVIQTEVHSQKHSSHCPSLGHPSALS